MTRALVDTSYLVALYNRSDAHHAACLATHQALNAELLTCDAVLAEAFHLLRREPGAAGAILASVEQGILEIPFHLSRSASRVREILGKYSDLPADFADACLVALAEEQDTGDILTLDSDFRQYRWRRNRRFHLLVPLN